VVIEDLVSDVFATAQSLAVQRGVSLLRHGQTSTTIRCDRRAMRQCLMVLLDNAVKFTPSGGVIRLQVTPGPDRCRIEVHDSGRGIEEQHLPYIFDRFYQADKSRATSGFGLGLSIAKGIVEAHQGRIGVISSRENGSCFYLELPLERRPEPSPTVTIWAPVQ
jgi:signal transduction histidine kinase